MQELLEKKNRNYAGITASAQGLYLFSVEYPSHFNLPILKRDIFYKIKDCLN